MNRRMKISALITIGLLLVTIKACALSSGPIDGQVLDEATGKPIADAIVVVRWKGDWWAVVESKTTCYHVETARTDINGKYHIAAWSLPWKAADTTVSGKVVYFNAYKIGYELSEKISSKLETVLLTSFKGTKDERFDYLDTLARTSSCAGGGESRKNLYRLYAPLVEEAETSAETESQEMLMQYMKRHLDRARTIRNQRGRAQ